MNAATATKTAVLIWGFLARRRITAIAPATRPKSKNPAVSSFDASSVRPSNRRCSIRSRHSRRRRCCRREHRLDLRRHHRMKRELHRDPIRHRRSAECRRLHRLRRRPAADRHRERRSRGRRLLERAWARAEAVHRPCTLQLPRRSTRRRSSACSASTPRVMPGFARDASTFRRRDRPHRRSRCDRARASPANRLQSCASLCRPSSSNAADVC